MYEIIAILKKVNQNDSSMGDFIIVIFRLFGVFLAFSTVRGIMDIVMAILRETLPVTGGAENA
jgi:hypothetical protein